LVAKANVTRFRGGGCTPPSCNQEARRRAGAPVTRHQKWREYAKPTASRVTLSPPRFRRARANAVGGSTESCYCEPVWGQGPGGVGQHQARNRRKVPGSHPGAARGPGRHGVSRTERNRRTQRRQRRSGNKIRTRGGPQPRSPPACRRKRNLRGKRQDPWRGANDRTCKRTVPTPRTRAGLRKTLQTQADPVRPRHAGRCAEDLAKKPHPTSHPRAGTNPVVAGSAAGPERFADVRADRRSVGELAAGDTRRVKPSAKCQ